MTARGARAQKRADFFNHPAWRHVAFWTGALALLLAVAGIALLQGVVR